VSGAYDPNLSNPFSGAPNMIPATSCNQSFNPTVNLEVPIELADNDLASNTSTTIYSRTRTSLNTSDYDGTVTYTFEIVAANGDSAPRNVSLLDSSGATVATVQVPNTGSSNQNNTRRYQVAFTPTSGANNYRIMLDGTTSSTQLLVTTGRIRVNQVGATQTKIYVPLTQGGPYVLADNLDSGAFVGDLQSPTYTPVNNNDGYSLWKKNNAAFSQLASSNPWTFEAVLEGASGGTAYASLFDANTGLQVAASELSTSSNVPSLVSQSFSDGATNFNDQDQFRVEIKGVNGGANIYHAGIWIKLTHLSHAEVYYRLLTGNDLAATSSVVDYVFGRTMIDPGSFSAPSIYFQDQGYIANGGSSCTVSLIDNGTTDNGAATTVVSGSSISLTATSGTVQRSSLLNLTPGNRFTVSIGPTTSTDCVTNSAFLVFGF